MFSCILCSLYLSIYINSILIQILSLFVFLSLLNKKCALKFTKEMYNYLFSSKNTEPVSKLLDLKWLVES